VACQPARRRAWFETLILTLVRPKRDAPTHKNYASNLGIKPAVYRPAVQAGDILTGRGAQPTL